MTNRLGTRTEKTSDRRASRRKAYSAPTLERYGTLTEITRASANSGMLDGGSFSLRTGGVV